MLLTKQAKTKNVNISRDQSALEYSSIWADEKLRPSSTNKQFYFVLFARIINLVNLITRNIFCIGMER